MSARPAKVEGAGAFPIWKSIIGRFPDRKRAKRREEARRKRGGRKEKRRRKIRGRGRRKEGG